MNIDSHLLETTHCPLCNHADCDSLYEFDPFQIVQCRSCGLSYLSPRLKEQEAIKLYEQDNYFFDNQKSGYSEYAEQEGSLRKTFRQFLKNLEHRQLTGGHLLEVGCGYGFLLDEAQPYFDHRTGTDFSPQAAQRARQYADVIYCGGLDALPENSRFDCIVATNVLEHTYNPVDFLKTLQAHLEPDGCIVMAVPNFSSFIRHLLRKKWPSFKVPEHTIYFKQDTLQRTFREANLINVAEIPFPHAFPLSLILGKFSIRLPAIANDMSLWIPTTMTATVGFNNEKSS